MHKITPNSSSPERSELSGPLVVALVYDGLCTFEFAIVAEVFGLPRPEMGPGWYRFAACAVEPGPLRAQGGLRVEVDGGADLLDTADLIVVPGWSGPEVPVPPALTARLIAAHARGARLASICSGAFVLAATGLLDGRRAATHWRYSDILQRAYPRVAVDAGVLYVDDGRLLTSAGSAAGIDLLLHVIRTDHGADAANRVARRLVVPPHRSGGQAQFVERPVPAIAPVAGTGLAPLLDRVRAEPARRWTVARLAREAAMSERTFLRRFAEATGRSPGDWLADVRTEEARRLLEATALSIEQVAARVGFGSAGAMRHHFGRATGLTPRDYRERFRGCSVPIS
jgi:AraC family transcriptional activator FtrA